MPRHPSGVVASLLAVRAKRVGRARQARPYGVAATPLYIATANGWQPFGGTTPLRAQRVLKGKGLIRKKGKTVRLSPSCAQCGRAGREYTVMDKQFRKTI